MTCLPLCCECILYGGHHCRRCLPGGGSAVHSHAQTPAPGDDIVLDIASPRGIWSDGTTVWVADWYSLDSEGRIYAYTLADGTPDSAKGFDLELDGLFGHSIPYTPYGIWSDGTTMWVAAPDAGTLYAHALADGTRDDAKDIRLSEASENPHANVDPTDDNAHPRGIWSDGTTMWVADHYDARIFAYNLTDGTRDKSKEFAIHDDDSGVPTGIWSDGTTMWVLHDGFTGNDRLHAYNLADGTRDQSKEFDLAAANAYPAGVWAVGDTMWVADFGHDRLYAYTLGAGTTTLPSADAGPDLTVDERKPVALAGTATDPDGDALTYSWTVSPAVPAIAMTGGDTLTPAFTAPNVASDTAFTFTLTVSDGAGIDTDTLTVTVLATGNDIPRDTAKEFDLDAANTDPAGAWSDGTTIWVADSGDDKLFAYALDGGARDDTKEFGLHSDNSFPRGIWSDGTTIWVADRTDDKLYAYTLDGGARDTAKEFDLADSTDAAEDNGNPYGVWSDGTTIWVADEHDDRLYAYTLDGGARDTAKEFGLHEDSGNRFEDNANPRGIWSDGDTMWVADLADNMLYAYTLDGGARDQSREFNLHRDGDNPAEDNGSPAGIWSDGDTMWVANFGNDRLFAYPLPGGTQPPPGGGDRHADREFGLAPDNDRPWGIWSDGDTMWVANDGNDRLYAYALSNGNRDIPKEFNLAGANSGPAGIWSDGTTIWVADYFNDRLYAYSLAGRTADSGKNIILASNPNNLAEDNDTPWGIWSDGTTMWVADNDGGKLYAYTISTKARDAAKEFDLAEDNAHPRGIWSDGTTMWVADSSGERLYAYALTDGARDAARDIDLNDLNGDPSGIWSDGDTMWVADWGDDKIYAYTLPGGTQQPTDGVQQPTDGVQQPTDGGTADTVAVSAGPAQVVPEGGTVVLQGTARFPGGGTVTYSWSHNGPAGIVLSGASSQTATFTAPQVGRDWHVTFRLTASDGEHSASDTVLVIIRNVPAAGQNAPPSIMLHGGPHVQLMRGASYQGPACHDAEDGAIADISSAGTVNAGTPGAYTVTYTCTDSGGLSDSETQKVTVHAYRAQIIMNKPNPVVLNVGDRYADPGASCAFSDGSSSPATLARSTVDVLSPGTYLVSYTCSDPSGEVLAAEARRVIVKAPDADLAPVIQRPAPMTVTAGQAWVDPGITCTDDLDPDPDVRVVASDLDVSRPGEYRVFYACTDDAGNQATAVRTVTVVPG